ncbi:unnamed protein product [Calypogeia fissa]
MGGTRDLVEPGHELSISSGQPCNRIQWESSKNPRGPPMEGPRKPKVSGGHNREGPKDQGSEAPMKGAHRNTVRGPELGGLRWDGQRCIQPKRTINRTVGQKAKSREKPRENTERASAAGQKLSITAPTGVSCSKEIGSAARAHEN